MAEHQPPPDQAELPKRKPYNTPRLTTYGAVRVLTQSNTSGSSEGSAGSGVQKPKCDIRLKQNIVRIGTHPLGIGLYLFDYKPEFREHGEDRQFGLMAHEVEAVAPFAVSVGADGYKTVDLVALGVHQYRH